MGGCNPWAPLALTATSPSISLREVRGGTAYASVSINNISTNPVDVKTNDTLVLQDGAGHQITGTVRVIGTVNAPYNGIVPGPMFTSADLKEIAVELPLLPPSPSAPQFVKDIPGQIVNWNSIKDFYTINDAPTLHLDTTAANKRVVLWITIQTGQTEWFTEQRTYRGNIQASVSSGGSSLAPPPAIPISLVVEGRTTLFEDAVSNTLVWSDHATRMGSLNILRESRGGNDPGASQANYYQDLLSHGSRMYFGWHPEAINYGFRRVVLDSDAFWQQVTSGNDPTTGKPWTHQDPNGSGRWIHPQEAADWAAGKEATYGGSHYLNADPTEFDRAVACWAEKKAPQDAGAFQPYSESYSYSKFLVQIWDEPKDYFAPLYERVAARIHVYNKAVRIMANPCADQFNDATVTGTLQVVNPDVTEWWPHNSKLLSFLSYLQSTGKPIYEYDTWGPYPSSAEDSSWRCYRRGPWVVPYYKLSGWGFWSAYAPTYGSGVRLIYPGPLGPIPTRNWEAFRRGSEDICMIQILRWRNLSSTTSSQLDQRVASAYDHPFGPGSNGEPDSFEQNRAWLVDMLSPPNS